MGKLLADAEWVQWSDREIAKRCGVDSEAVAGCRMSLWNSAVTGLHQDGAVEDEPRTYVDKHGHTSTMNVAKIGSKPAAALAGEPAIGLSKEDYDAELAQMRAEYLERLPAEVELLRAQLESAQADDLKAEAMKWRQMSEHHMREQSYAMDRAKEARDRAWVMKQLRRCGKAVGEDGPGKIGAQVEALVRRARETV